MKISRHNFFSTLSSLIGAFLVTITAKAQSATIITPCRPKLQWQNQTPLCNGQCPNSDCAYRAPSFEKKNYARVVSEELGLVAFDTPEYTELIKYGEVYWERDPKLGSILSVPKVRLNRCPNCNTAFWQDPSPEAK